MTGNFNPAAVEVAVVDAAAFAMRAENRACAARHTAAYELYEECLRAWRSSPDSRESADFSRVDPFRVCRTHLVSAFAIGDRRAGGLLAKAIVLTERLPAALQAMADGLMDENTANIIASQTRTVDDDCIGAIQARIVSEHLEAILAGKRPSAAAVARDCDVVIAEMDPEGLRRRAKDALRQRHLRLDPAPDGMADLKAHLTAGEAAAIARALDDHPSTADTSSEDDRGIGERRADALCALTLNPDTPGKPSTIKREGGQPAAGNGAAPVVRPQVTIIADPREGRFRVWFQRSGFGAVEDLIALLARSNAATTTLVDPAIGAADDAEQVVRYRPSAALARQVRLRDGTCRHPGCAVPADNCDIDHLTPFDFNEPVRGGLTTESNLVCLCRAHHRLKTFTGWRYQLSERGVLRLTTEAGHTLYTSPTGPLAHGRNLKQQLESAHETRAETDAEGGPPDDPPPF